jgi:hypothetical protein
MCDNFHDKSMEEMSGFKINLYDIFEADLKTFFCDKVGPVLRLF